MFSTQLFSNDCCMHVAQWHNAPLREAGIRHPSPAIRRRVFGTVCGLDQHVEACEQPSRLTACVIDQRVIDNECPARRQRLIGLLHQGDSAGDTPVVKNPPHDEDIGCGSGSVKKSPEYNVRRSDNCWDATYLVNAGPISGRSKPPPRKCGWARAISTGTQPCAVPMSMKVR